MVRACVVCKKVDHLNRHLSFHRFPQDPQKRKFWFSLVGIREGESLPKFPALCSDHFFPEDLIVKVDGSRSIKKNANPRRCEGVMFLDDVSSSDFGSDSTVFETPPRRILPLLDDIVESSASVSVEIARPENNPPVDVLSIPGPSGIGIAKCSLTIKNMSIQLQSISKVLSVSPEKTELLTAIKNEPLESEIGIDDIPNSLDEEIIPDIKDIDIVSHELSEDLIKSETVSESTFENDHLESVETQVFVKTEHIPLIKTENITQSEYQDISDKQNKKSYCEKCTFISKNRSYFKRHKLSHKTEAEVDGRYLKYRCDRCEFKTCWSSSLKIHKLKHLKPEEIPYLYCYHCPYNCKRKGSLKRHIFNHFKKEEVPFHCYICDFTTLKKDLIIEHFKKHSKHHSKCDEIDYKNQIETYTKYRCDKCKFKTCWFNRLKTHKLKHLKPEEIPYFYCYHCPYKCKLKNSLKIHIFNHFKKQEVSFYCYICDFTTLERNLIIEHFKKHPKYHSKYDETDFKNQFDTYNKYHCDNCKYKTYFSSHFKLHKLKHLKPEEIPYFCCYHCPHKSKRKSSLKRHIFNHFKKEEVPFHCYICDFTTLKRNLIIEHFKKHPKHHSKCDKTDYETYAKKQMRHRCNKCSFGTYHYVWLKLHELTHKVNHKKEAKTEYRCDKCKYKTFRLNTFKTHKLIHLKPEEIQYFYCYHCSYKSKRKGNLKTHIFSHFKRGEIPFHCYICDFVTLKRESFKKHLKHHNRCDETEYRNELLRFYKIL